MEESKLRIDPRRTVQYRPLEQVLQPATTDRLLRKDIERRTALPAKITDGARFKGGASVTFFANASAGDQFTTVSLGLDTVPLAMVWHLGSIDKVGTVINGSGLVAGIFNAESSIVTGTGIFSGAQAAFSCTKDELTIGVTSTNVGWPDFITAYFYYAVFYDDTGVKDLGI